VSELTKIARIRMRSASLSKWFGKREGEGSQLPFTIGAGIAGVKRVPANAISILIYLPR